MKGTSEQEDVQVVENCANLFLLYQAINALKQNCLGCGPLKTWSTWLSLPVISSCNLLHSLVKLGGVRGVFVARQATFNYCMADSIRARTSSNGLGQPVSAN